MPFGFGFWGDNTLDNTTDIATLPSQMPFGFGFWGDRCEPKPVSDGRRRHKCLSALGSGGTPPRIFTFPATPLSQMPFGFGFWGDCPPATQSCGSMPTVTNAFRLWVLGGLSQCKVLGESGQVGTWGGSGKLAWHENCFCAGFPCGLRMHVSCRQRIGDSVGRVGVGRRAVCRPGIDAKRHRQRLFRSGTGCRHPGYLSSRKRRFCKR
jgi:hypothetical protein